MASCWFLYSIPLDLELGYRYSDFSTAGGGYHKATMFTWNAMDNLTFRGGYQLATRAPNIAELFTAPTLEVVFHPDQDNCSVTTLAHGVMFLQTRIVQRL